VGKFNDSISVYLRTTGSLLARAEAHVSNQSTFMVGHEEVTDSPLVVGVRSGHRRDPDCSVELFLHELLHIVEVINKDVNLLRKNFLGKLDLVELA